MRPRFHIPLLSLALLVATLVLVRAVPAQQQPEPKRPQLDAGAETNHAAAYHRHGVSYGYVLAAADRLDEAAAQFRKATELEPYYSLPHFLLGRIMDAGGKRAEALAHYNAFIARASRRAPQLEEARKRVTELAGPG
jgi:tetratricopeptide (TPR) repeat protein